MTDSFPEKTATSHPAKDRCERSARSQFTLSRKRLGFVLEAGSFGDDVSVSCY